MEKYTNDLIREQSPYLKQHAHNPVNWLPWSDEAFDLAQKEDKLVLVSVGYSACHWCHVMERESFEDEEVATWMNRYFVCIKVDREERPDVDQVYMAAVQLMTQRGGWPLNCFTLPDGRPVYGGTYFPKEQWIHVLKSLEDTYRKKRDEVLEYAEKLSQGVRQTEHIVEAELIRSFQADKLNEMLDRWKPQFDLEEGGANRAPKFPLPNNYEFLLHYGMYMKDQEVLDHLSMTLDKMMRGGIYDQLGGGFYRYSVDINWKIPHFEKMLYDNAQLLSLYAEAYKLKPNLEYEHLMRQSMDWLKREMQAESGAFYSALDADSEGEEGKFYVWELEELEEMLNPSELELIRSYYEMNRWAHWEDGKYQLLRRVSNEEKATQMGLESKEMMARIREIESRMMQEREKRPRPGLDYKCLTSWNAMMIRACVDVGLVLGEDSYLEMAEKAMDWIREKMWDSEGLSHVETNGVRGGESFLEDYAHVIQASIRMYEADFDLQYLEDAKKLCEQCIELFWSDSSGMFYFTDHQSGLIARKMEINDNVIPSSNSVMCRNLIRLGHYFDETEYLKMAQQQLSNVYDGMDQYGSAYSNWGQALMEVLGELTQIGIGGVFSVEEKKKLGQIYWGSVMFYQVHSKLPLTADKNPDERGLYYCKEGACSLPEENIESFLERFGPRGDVQLN